MHTVRALDRLIFTVKDGEIVALIGPSGCGKTTALRIAMGLDFATGGRVWSTAIAVKGCGYDRGMVFQHAELLPWLSALENVMFGLEMKGVRGAGLRETAMQYLKLVGLGDSWNRRPYQLSGGMQQRVGIARALGDRSEGAADGRAVRRARRADSRDACRVSSWKSTSAPTRPSCS